MTFITSLSELCFSDITTVSSDKYDDRCLETTDFGDDVEITMGISNTENDCVNSSSDMSVDGDEGLSLAQGVDNQEISIGMLVDGERGETLPNFKKRKYRWDYNPHLVLLLMAHSDLMTSGVICWKC